MYVSRKNYKVELKERAGDVIRAYLLASFGHLASGTQMFLMI